jgi:hypothetical protein
MQVDKPRTSAPPTHSDIVAHVRTTITWSDLRSVLLGTEPTWMSCSWHQDSKSKWLSVMISCSTYCYENQSTYVKMLTLSDYRRRIQKKSYSRKHKNIENYRKQLVSDVSARPLYFHFCLNSGYDYLCCSTVHMTCSFAFGSICQHYLYFHKIVEWISLFSCFFCNISLGPFVSVYHYAYAGFVPLPGILGRRN